MTERNLSVSLRPQTLAELIGQDDLRAKLVAQLDSGRVPTAFLFSGPPGTGKTTLARILSRAVQGDSHGPFDIFEVNASALNGVDAVKEIVAGTEYRPLSGRFKVIILDEAQRLTNPAQQILLKNMEDAPEHLVWFFCTTDPAKLIPALRSRCLPFKLSGLDEKGVTDLVDRAIAASGNLTDGGELAKELWRQRVTSPRNIIMAVEKYLSGESAEKAAQITDETSVSTIDICRAVTNKSAKWTEIAKLLSAASPEDGRAILASVAGYLRSCLLRGSDPLMARALRALTDALPFEDGLAWSAAVARIYEAAVILRSSQRS